MVFLVNHTSQYPQLTPATDTRVDYAMKGSIMAALYNFNTMHISAGNIALPDYFCEASKCDYPATSSIGVQALCTALDPPQRTCVYDPARDASADSPGCDVTLANSNLTLGGELKARNRIVSVQTTRKSGSQPLVYKDALQPLAVIQSISSIGSLLPVNSTSTLAASECVLLPVVRSYKSCFNCQEPGPDGLQSGGVTITDEEKGVFDAYTVDNATGDIVFHLPSNAALGVDGTLRHGISSASYRALQAYLDDIFNGVVLASSGSTYGDGSNELLGSTMTQDYTTYSEDKVPVVAKFVAVGMTRGMRNARSNVLMDNADDDPTAKGIATRGQMWTRATFVVVSWPW